MTVPKRRNRPGAGRPPRYKSRAELEKRIEAYFESIKGELLRDEETGKPVIDKRGRVVMIGERPPTVTGLALALGFATRKSLLEYEAKPQFAEAIARAKSRIEMYAEERLYDRDGCMGARFNLRNNFRDWGDEGRMEGGDVEDLSPLAELLKGDA